MRSHSATHDAMHRHRTAPTLLTQLALVAATPLALWALAHPVPTMLTLAALAALTGYRYVGRRPTRLTPRRSLPSD